MVLTAYMGIIACGGDDPPAEGSPAVAVDLHAAPSTPASEPEPAPPPPPDFEIERRFSPPSYASAASRVIPYSTLVTRALGAARRTELQAVELDFFEDDWLYRQGGMVLLGTERGRVVALTTRYYADIRYPDPRLVSDGWGAAEIGRQYLAVPSPGSSCARGKRCAPARFRLRPFGSGRRERGSSFDEPVVEYRFFDDHDVALLYFPRQGSPFRRGDTLGVPNPTRAIELRLQDASGLYGFEMTIISKESLAELRARIEVESIAGSLLGLGISLLANPLLESVAGSIDGSSSELQRKMAEKVSGVISDYGADALAGVVVPIVDEWEQRGKRLDDDPRLVRSRPPAPSRTPSVIPSARLEVTDRGVEVIGRDDHEPPVRLLGVEIGDDGRDELRQYVARALGAGRVIISSDTWGETPAGALVLLPGDSVVLNVEILRHGFARLDLEHAELVRSFPWLVDAAWEALQNRTGLAREWAGDDDYVAALRSLRTDSGPRAPLAGSR